MYFAFILILKPWSENLSTFFPSYRTFYEGPAGYAVVPVNFFLVSEADKALTMDGGEEWMGYEKKKKMKMGGGEGGEM